MQTEMIQEKYRKLAKGYRILAENIEQGVHKRFGAFRLYRNFKGRRVPWCANGWALHYGGLLDDIDPQNLGIDENRIAINTIIARSPKQINELIRKIQRLNDFSYRYDCYLETIARTAHMISRYTNLLALGIEDFEKVQFAVDL